MKTLRKFRKNAKALSPVVASIILIAVTVAVSIAVAAWMGALTVGFMGTEELRISNVQFNDGNIVASVRNTGTTPVTIEQAYVNGDLYVHDLTDAIAENQEANVTITFTHIDGNNYQIKLVTSKGNPFVYTATAPG